MDKTRVIFRTWDSGDVIALFPDIDEGRGHCSSYEHIGQHGPADYGFVVRDTRPATADEYAALKAELTSIGYDLDIKKRR